jgi:hypothetical protein
MDIIDKNERKFEESLSKFEESCYLLSYDKKFYNVQTQRMDYKEFPVVAKEINNSSNNARFAGLPYCIAVSRVIKSKIMDWFVFLGNS